MYRGRRRPFLSQGFDLTPSIYCINKLRVMINRLHIYLTYKIHCNILAIPISPFTPHPHFSRSSVIREAIGRDF